MSQNFVSLTQVEEEIERQGADKSCGIDGIHIRFIKALVGTQLTVTLQHLYSRCVQTGTTPSAWNQSEIHMIIKSIAGPRDATNLRPISLIGMFRKIFERLLLVHCQSERWAQLHSCQTGFRCANSTYTNAAVVHAMLAGRQRTTAIFLDFKAAFDTVDHTILITRLQERGCPRMILRLIYSLMCRSVQSRLYINGEVSRWFPRTCGVLQGSPLSPWLFNIFIDGLVGALNMKGSEPACLFYADDGVILPPVDSDAQALLSAAEAWAAVNRLELRFDKCGFVSRAIDPLQLFLCGQQLRACDSYPYLGFPMTATGIDFPVHLRLRTEAAAAKARWLGVKSDQWGVANRLRVYRQFLAPMFEYGAPLVWAWAKETAANAAEFERSTEAIKEMLAWIGNYKGGRHLVTLSLCGLLPPGDRFQHIFTGYQRAIDQMASTNPLKLLTIKLESQPFVRALSSDVLFTTFKLNSSFEPSVKVALQRFLRLDYRKRIEAAAQGAGLTRLIPPSSRRVRGLFMADCSLSGAGEAQGQLFQYRRGVFLFNTKCVCGIRFHRGHEACGALAVPLRLTHADRQLKRSMAVQLSVTGFKFTDIDFLLNCGRVKEAADALRYIQTQIHRAYSATLPPRPSPLRLNPPGGENPIPPARPHPSKSHATPCLS